MSYQNTPLMETTTTLQSPSTESFSYSWLANLNPIISAADHEHHDDETSFIEMDPRLPPSRRFFCVTSSATDLYNFNFPDVSPSGLVHADELISNGFLVTKDRDAIKTDVRGDYASTDQKKRVSLRKCRRLSMRGLKKYLKYLLRPLVLYGMRRRRRRRGGEYDDDDDDDEFDGDDERRRMKWELSAATVSPRTSLAYSSADDDWRRSCDSESSIYEAVLHCKRTHG